jgi:DNA-binding NarL/FixJ family response regulator
MQSQVIICDQQTVYALGSHSLLKNNPQYRNPSIINHIDDLPLDVETDESRVLVIDSAMLEPHKRQSMAKIMALKEKMPIMVVLNEQDDFVLYQLIENGMSVIVSRDVSKQEWLKGVEMAKRNKVFFSTTIANKVFSLVNNMSEIQLIEKVGDLSIYDKYVLIRICQEASSKEIALELNYSKRTIEGHRTKLMQLFEVKNLAGLVKVACVSRLYNHYLSNPGLYDVTLCAKTSAL